MASQTTQQIAQSSVAIGGSVASMLVPASFVPVVGIAIVGIGLALSVLFNRKGGKQKLAATDYANQAEDLLKQNLAAYFELPAPRSTANQEAALANFDMAWQQLISPQFCGDPNLGNAGKRCISERQRGGTAPWCPTGTGCDWFTLYRDPIALDPAQSANDSAQQAFSSLFDSDDSSVAQYLIPAALVGLALLL